MIESEVDPLPPAFEAVTVYVVAGEVTVGVPEMVQVEESNESPAGSNGEIEQLVIGLPVFVGVFAAIATPAVNVEDPPLKAMTGATVAALTEIEIVVAPFPPAFEAVTV